MLRIEGLEGQGRLELAKPEFREGRRPGQGEDIRHSRHLMRGSPNSRPGHQPGPKTSPALPNPVFNSAAPSLAPRIERRRSRSAFPEEPLQQSRTFILHHSSGDDHPMVVGAAG